MKRETEKKKRSHGARRRKRVGSHGVITVFVTLIMVPVVTITSLMVDVSRLKLYSSQALVAADAYGDSVLSKFDNLLKDLYGLFALTQNEEGLAAIENLAIYAGYSFNPNGGDEATGGGRNLTGFMPYKNADVQFGYEKVNGASLSNHNVLMTQISDFMKYRIIEEVMDEVGILSSITRIDASDEYMDVVQSRNKITDSSAEALGKIEDYYKELKKLAAYPNYLKGRQEAFEAYSSKLREIAASEEYEEYVNYKINKTAIDAAKEAYDSYLIEYEHYEEEYASYEEDLEQYNQAVAAREAAGNPAGGEVLEEPEEPTEPEIDEETKDLAGKWINEGKRRQDFENQLQGVQKAAQNNSNTFIDSDSENYIDFNNTEDTIKKLGVLAQNLEEVLEELQEQMNELRRELAECPDEPPSEDGEMTLKEKIQDEVRGLEEIADMAGEFRETYNLIQTEHDDIGLNKGNKELMEQYVPELDTVRENLLSANVQPRDDYWKKSVPLVWYDFQDDKEAFYEQLQKLCGSDENTEGSNKLAEENKKKGKKAQEDAQKAIDKDDEDLPDARDISDNLAAQLASHGDSVEEVPGMLEMFTKGGFSFKTLQSIGSSFIDKFLVISYDFGMFSSRVSGKEPEEKKNSEGGAGNGAGGAGNGTNADGAGNGADEGYRDYSLTKVVMSRDVNYLYGAELEYVLGGHNKSEKNLKYVRNVICTIQTTMNFLSTYRINEINNIINSIANTAAEAVAATVVGAVAAPLVRVAVSGALRLGAAAIMTAADWNSLKERKNIVLFKTKLADVELTDGLKELLDFPESVASDSNGGELNYEDYLRILMFFQVLADDDTVLERTSNLITLNVNQALNEEDELSNLSFLMNNTVTAVEATCKVKMDFAVVPRNLLEMYLKNTNTETMIKTLEDHYFGYSVIRGY